MGMNNIRKGEEGIIEDLQKNDKKGIGGGLKMVANSSTLFL